jgi:hypothetical protein
VHDYSVKIPFVLDPAIPNISYNSCASGRSPTIKIKGLERNIGTTYTLDMVFRPLEIFFLVRGVHVGTAVHGRDRNNIIHGERCKLLSQ